MTAKKRSFTLMGLLCAAALLVSGCQQLTLKDQINRDVLPSNANDPWITSFSDRSVTLSWSEPSDPDMGAVEVIATPTFTTGVTPLQAVIAAGSQGVTLYPPSNNAPYTITVYMVDKAGHVADTGVSTKNSSSPHYLYDAAGHVDTIRSSFVSQLPVKTVATYSGTGVGIYQGYNSYAYDSTTGLPNLITSYDSSGNQVSKHAIQYATGGINRVRDLLYNYSTEGWKLSQWVNTYYDSSGRITKTELYGGAPPQLEYTSTYSQDASGNLTGWVTSDSAGNTYQKISYFDLGTREQWVQCNASGVIAAGGLIENGYDSAGRSSTIVQYNTNDMSISSKTTLQYDANGNLQKITRFNTSEQTGYSVYSY